MADPRRPDGEDLLRLLAQHAPQTPTGACPETDMLAAFVSGGLTSLERPALEQHLVRCGPCLAVVTDLADQLEVMEEPPGRLHLAREEQGRLRPRRWLLPAAALLLIGFAVWALQQSAAPVPEPTLLEAAAALRETHGRTCADLVPLSADELAQPSSPSERGGIALFAPSGTLLNARLTFRFEPVPGVSEYQIQLLTSSGDVLWKASTSTTEMAYPKGEPTLSSGTNYLWTLAYDRLGRQEVRAAFAIATEDEAMAFRSTMSAIETNAPAPHRLLLKAHLAIRRGYWGEARDLTQSALEAHPDGAAEQATARYMRVVLGELPSPGGER